MSSRLSPVVRFTAAGIVALLLAASILLWATSHSPSAGVGEASLRELRLNFPPLEPEREARLRERNRAAFADDPRRAELERRLLGLGGILALLFLPDPDIGELLDRGRDFPGAGAMMRPGAPSDCHANAAMMFVETKGEIKIATGYALSDDGLWRQHSWGVRARDGQVTETSEPRVRYYGVVLDDAGTIQFVLSNTRKEDVGARKLEEIHRFLRKFFGRATVEQVEDAMSRPTESAARSIEQSQPP